MDVLILPVRLVTSETRPSTRVTTWPTWRFSWEMAGAAKAPAMKAGTAKRENFIVAVLVGGGWWINKMSDWVSNKRVTVTVKA